MPVLLLEIAAIILGIDVYSISLRWIGSVFGPSAISFTATYYVMFAVQYVHVSAGPSVITLGLLLPLIWASPSRRWRRSLIAVLLANSIWFPVYGFMTTVHFLEPTLLHNAFPWLVSMVTRSMFFYVAVLHFLFPLALYFHTRSRPLLLIASIPWIHSGLYNFLSYEMDIRMMWWPPHLPEVGGIDAEFVLWHAALVVVFALWVARARRSLRSSCHCWHCAYDLTSHNPTAPCPECGNVIPEDHPLCTSPSPAFLVSSARLSPAN